MGPRNKSEDHCFFNGLRACPGGPYNKRIYMALTLPQEMLIDGQWLNAADGKTMTVKNPANDDEIGTIPRASGKEVAAAIEAAHEAFPKWADLTAYERSKILRKWWELILVNKENLAQIMTLESGKPVPESRAEIDYAASFVEFFAEEIKRPMGEIIPAAVANRSIRTILQPVGVCGMITPWNFPSSMVTRKAAAAFAAGCTVVLKPDHRTPYSATALGVLAQQAGMPPGVFNIVTGDAAEIGKIFCAHPKIAKIGFTGSTRVGKILMEQSAPFLKKLSLELGGNAPFIVCDDADLDIAVEQAVIGKFRNAGQSCVSPSRFFVAKNHYDVFLKALEPKVAALKTGTDIGPLIDTAAVAKVDELVQGSIKKGARLIIGGTSNKNFYSPTLLADVPADSPIEQNEIFGPVMAVSPFDSDEQALQRANAVDVGLAAYVFTTSLKREKFFTEKLQFGMVGVNTGMMSFAGSPFGGVKESGFGREGARQGLEAYLETKAITVQN